MNLYAKMHKIHLTIIAFLCLSTHIYAIPMQALADSLTVYANSNAEVGVVTVKRVRTSGNTARIYTCKTLSSL